MIPSTFLPGDLLPSFLLQLQFTLIFRRVYIMVLNAMLHIYHRSTRRINVDSMMVLRRYVENKIAINFHDVTTYFLM